MSEQLEYKLKNAKIIYFAHKKSKTAKLLVARYCLNGILTAKPSYLQTAYDISKAASELNPIDLDLRLLQIFILINQKRFKEAKSFLDTLNYVNKNTDPLGYTKIIYITALLKNKISSLRSVGKYYKILENLSKEIDDSLINVFLADIAVIAYSNESIACEHLNIALAKGSNNPLIYINYIKIINSSYININNRNLIALIKWCLINNILVASILVKTNELLKSIDYSNQQLLLEQMYQRIQSNWALSFIVQHKIQNDDTSVKALSYYKEALSNNVFLPSLNTQLLKTLRVNKIDNIPVQIISELLSEDMALDDLAFLYHLFITNQKYSEFLNDNLKNILELGIKLLLEEKTGIYYNSIYKKMFEIFPNEQKLLKIFAIELFVYDVYIPSNNVKYIWIQEAEKKKVSIYTVYNNYVKISVATEEFKCYCFGERSYINAYYKIVKRLNIPGHALYEILYSKGFITEDLIIAMSKYYLEQELFNQESIEILKHTLSLNIISEKLCSEICIKLGIHYATIKKHEKAYAYFSASDNSDLTSTQLEQLIEVLLSQKQMKKAIDILILRYKELSEAVLFRFIKQTCVDEENNHLISDIAFNLLINSCFDKQLLDLVLEKYECSVLQWLKLRKVLSKMGVVETVLDEKIISDSISSQLFNEISDDILPVFLNLKSSKYLYQFIYYIVYQVIVNKAPLSYNTVVALEAIYLDNYVDDFIVYALCHAYIEQGIITKNTSLCIERASRQMETSGILFPFFRNIKDTIYTTPYIEKNMPFEYKSLPDKKVFLCYELEGKVEKINMNYVRFGIYQCAMPLFSKEQITYYFEEENNKTAKETKFNDFISIREDTNDVYFEINNAIVYAHLLKYDKVEEILSNIISARIHSNFEMM